MNESDKNKLFQSVTLSVRRYQFSFKTRRQEKKKKVKIKKEKKKMKKVDTKKND